MINLPTLAPPKNILYSELSSCKGFSHFLLDVVLKGVYQMARLDELCVSLATLIIRYHDHQGKNLIIEDKSDVEKQSRDHAMTILAFTDVSKVREAFTAIITDCTTGYMARKPFLDFILNEVMYLHCLMKSIDALSDSALACHQAQVELLIKDCLGLLSTQKDKKYAVTYSRIDTQVKPPEIDLSGLSGWTYLCASGNYLGEALMRVNINRSLPYGTIIHSLKEMCTNYQSIIIAPQQKLDLMEIRRELAAVKEQLQGELKNMGQKNTELEATNRELLTSSTTAQKLQKELTGVKEPVSAAVQRDSEMENLQCQLQTAQDTVKQQGKTIRQQSIIISQFTNKTGTNLARESKTRTHRLTMFGSGTMAQDLQPAAVQPEAAEAADTQTGIAYWLGLLRLAHPEPTGKEDAVPTGTIGH